MKIYFLTLSIGFLSCMNLGYGQQSKTTNFDELIIDFVSSTYPDYTFSNFIYVGIKRQELVLFENAKIVNKYPISSAKNGSGNEFNSEKTPLGLHTIKSKYGHKTPTCGVFDHRKFTGEITTINHDTLSTNKDIISSRIIRIEGLEQGYNKGEGVDTYMRKIYIHGTNEEGLIGQQVSHGCIRMKNIDIVELFNKVNNNMLIVILDN